MDQPNSKKKKAIYILAALALSGVVFLTINMLSNIGRVTTDDAYIDGRIHSIAARISGTVEQVYAGDNQGVEKGQLLLDIDPADYQLKLNEARAALEAEKARLNDAQVGITSAQVSLNQAALDKQRAEALFKDNVIPKDKYEKALTAYDLAAAQLKAAGERSELEKALIKQREVALQAAELNLSYTRIYAPSDGYVTKKSVEAGNQIQAGQPLMAVIALNDIWVTANFKETQLKDMRPGQKVLIKIDTYPGKLFSGKVDSIMAGTGAAFSLFPPENALGNYVKVVQRVPVKIVFDKDAGRQQVLRIGMSCEPSILTRNGQSK